MKKNSIRFMAVLVLAVVLLALMPATVIAGKPAPSDIEKYRGSVTAGSPSTVTFNTLANETAVILTFQARNGGDRTLEVYDSAGALVGTISIPAEVTSGWGTCIAVNPSSTYTVVINVSSGRTGFTLYVNHCPDGMCF